MAEQVGTNDVRTPGEAPGHSYRCRPEGGGAQTQAACPQPGLHAAISPCPLDRPVLLVRAARHYEGAGQILIRQAVMSAQHFVSTEPVGLPAPGQWVVAECPARVDFSGESLGGG